MPFRNKRYILGVVGVVMGFDSFAEFDESDTRGPKGANKYLWFAKELKKRSKRFTRFSIPVPASVSDRGRFIALVAEIRKLGFTVVGVGMFGDIDPGDPKQQDAAEAHLNGIYDNCTAAEITEIMGPMGFQWGVGADEAPLSGDELDAHLTQAALVTSNVINNRPESCTVTLVSQEFLSNCETNRIVDSETCGIFCDKINDAKTDDRVAVGEANDTAHTYHQLDSQDHAIHGQKTIEQLRTETRTAFESGRVTLGHVSIQGTRAHPLKDGEMPLEEHLELADEAGFDGPWDIESFDPSTEAGGIRGVGESSIDYDEPWTPFIETAEAIDSWTGVTA